MAGDPLYDTDFYTWTQRQAELLARSDDPHLDTQNLAEEVAALGRTELRACESHLLQALITLVHLAARTSVQFRGHLEAEADMQLEQGQKAFSPGMRPHIDVAHLWHWAIRIANRQLSDYSETLLPSDLPCPFTLDDLLTEDIEPGAVITQTLRAVNGWHEKD